MHSENSKIKFKLYQRMPKRKQSKQSEVFEVAMPGKKQNLKWKGPQILQRQTFRKLPKKAKHLQVISKKEPTKKRRKVFINLFFLFFLDAKLVSLKIIYVIQKQRKKDGNKRRHHQSPQLKQKFSAFQLLRLLQKAETSGLVVLIL